MSATDKPDPAEAAIYERISSSLDRLREAHFWLHGVEQYYHFAEPFRWHLNSFLKALKEVPQLLSMELQQAEGFKEWFVPKRTALHSDPLLKALHDHRDFVVHQGMLIPKSTAMIGITEGRGMKLGVTFPVHPLEDSDGGMKRYVAAIKVSGDFLGTLIDDEDSLPCVERYWHLPNFDEEVAELCARAWLRLGETVGEVLTWLGASPPSLSLDCRHASQQLHYKLYERADAEGLDGGYDRTLIAREKLDYSVSYWAAYSRTSQAGEPLMEKRKTPRRAARAVVLEDIISSSFKEDGSLLGPTLRGHLVIEALLVELIATKQPAIDAWGLSFPAKTRLAEQNGLIEVGLREGLGLFNDYRNDFAHIFGFPSNANDIHDLARDLEQCGVDFSDSVGRYPLPEALSNYSGVDGILYEVLWCLSYELAFRLMENGGRDLFSEQPGLA